MQAIKSKLTVFFDDPFWVGFYERISDGRVQTCKITFGAEPKDYEVYAFFLQNWNKLCFGASVRCTGAQDKKINPKRMQREINKLLSASGIGTKAQQAIKLQREEGKETRKKQSRLQREEEKERQFELRQIKRKQKHKGH